MEVGGIGSDGCDGRDRSGERGDNGGDSGGSGSRESSGTVADAPAPEEQAHALDEARLPHRPR